MSEKPEPTTRLAARDVLWARDFGSEEVKLAVMGLIEEAILASKDTDPPRHILSILWGKVRDL